MKKLIAAVLCLSFLGCAAHFHNEKTIKGKAEDIKTKVGTVEGAQADYDSTFDLWIPWRSKECNEYAN